VDLYPDTDLDRSGLAVPCKQGLSREGRVNNSASDGANRTMAD